MHYIHHCTICNTICRIRCTRIMRTIVAVVNMCNPVSWLNERFDASRSTRHIHNWYLLGPAGISSQFSATGLKSDGSGSMMMGDGPPTPTQELDMTTDHRKCMYSGSRTGQMWLVLTQIAFVVSLVRCRAQ